MKQSDSEFADCPIPFPTYNWRGKGIRGVDGDTDVVKLDRGFFDSSTKELRLWDIDTWERLSGTTWEKLKGAEAKAFANERVGDNWLRITTYMDPEKYGRILAGVEYWRDGKLVNLTDELRANGFEKLARAWRGAHQRSREHT